MGTPKGLLEAPGSRSSIPEHLVSLGREVGLDVVLVGDATPHEGLAKGVARLADDPPGAWPLGGLRASLRYGVQEHHSHVVGHRSFQRLFASLEVEPLRLSPAVERALRDWDTPEDVGT